MKTAYHYGQRVQASYFLGHHQTVRGTIITHRISLYADVPDEVEVLVDSPESGIYRFPTDRVRPLDVVELLAEVVTRSVSRAGGA